MSKMGPAFPWQHAQGMTLRDYFAGRALQKLLPQTHFTDQPSDVEYLSRVASSAYRVADAMLNARGTV